MSTLVRTGLVVATLTMVVGGPVLAYAAPTSSEPTPAATASASVARLKVTSTTPTDDYSSVTLTITGLKHGQGVRITGAPKGWGAESWYNVMAHQSGSGPLVVSFPGPAGWPEDIPFVWKVAGEHGATAETSFVYRGEGKAEKPKPTTTRTPTKATKPPASKRPVQGGLAATGV